MKKTLKHISTVLFVGLLLGLTGCHYETRHGRIYLALEPSPQHFVEYYWDNNPSIPSDYFWGEYYRSRAGTFEYEYALGDGFVYFGHYTLVANYTTSSTHHYHDDPDDRYYSFYLLDGGAHVDYYNAKTTGVQALRDTTFSAGGYQMTVTRNRIPVKQFTSTKQPKYIGEREENLNR